MLVEVCVLAMNEIFLERSKQDEAAYQQRQTLVPVAAGVLRYGIYFSAVVMALREAGIDPTPILAGAGVVGVAVGLGAQAFVGDIVAGFFILFENLFLVGDFIAVGDIKGKVGADPAVIALIAEGDDDSVPYVVAVNAAAQDLGFKANELVQQLGAAVGGRGGGKADLAQGSGKGAAGIDAGLAALRAELGRS